MFHKEGGMSVLLTLWILYTEDFQKTRNINVWTSIWICNLRSKKIRVRKTWTLPTRACCVDMFILPGKSFNLSAWYRERCGSISSTTTPLLNRSTSKPTPCQLSLVRCFLQLAYFGHLKCYWLCCLVNGDHLLSKLSVTKNLHFSINIFERYREEGFTLICNTNYWYNIFLQA